MKLGIAITTREGKPREGNMGGDVILPAPVLTVAGTVTFTEGDAPQFVVDPSTNLTLTGFEDILGAKATIGGGFEPEDSLSVAGALPGSLTAAYNAATGVLTISGAGSPSEYEAALRQVVFSNSSEDPSPTARTVTFNIGSSLAFTGNGHFYEFVAQSGISWTSAEFAAGNKTLFGLQGYLVTVLSEAENTFVTGKLEGSGWLGATDVQNDKIWRWVTGPEAGTYFFTQNGFPCGIGGSGVAGLYNNWALNEPNDHNTGCANKENYGHFFSNGLVTGTFSDVGTLDTHTLVIDWGGSEGTSVPTITGAGTFSASHTYLDDGDNPGGGDASEDYTITVTVTDDDGGIGTATNTVTVDNVAPAFETGTGDQENPFGTEIEIDVTFSDIGTLDTHTYSIDWGDSTPVITGSTGGSITASHQYHVPGDQTVTVCVTDDDGGQTCQEVAITFFNTVGKVTAGSMRGGNFGRGGFNVQSKDAIEVKGEQQFKNDALNYHAHEMTAIAVSEDGTSAWFSGIDDNGDFFVAYVEDNGEPGTNDIFQLWINGVSQNGDGAISGGNVQIHDGGSDPEPESEPQGAGDPAPTGNGNGNGKGNGKNK